MQVAIKLAEGATSPKYQTSGSSGADVYAHIPEPVVIEPGKSVLIGSGNYVALPDGYEFQVRPRSGLALKNSITVLNTPGTIDADFRNEIGVILINHGVNAFTVEPGMRIAQLVMIKVEKAEFVLTDVLPVADERNLGGFGHTGL